MIPITVINGTGYLFNIEHVREIREKFCISGVLVGILPQFPQQNVFMGLPLQLTPEETKLLVDEGACYLINNTDLHGLFYANTVESGDARVQMASNAHDDLALVTRARQLAQTHPVIFDEPVPKVYSLYKYLTQQNMFCMPGLRFGCNFLAYPGDPLRYHAHYNVRALEWEEPFKVLDIVGCGRLATAVKKCWVVGAESEDYGYRAFSIEWAGFG